MELDVTSSTYGGSTSSEPRTTAMAPLVDYSDSDEEEEDPLVPVPGAKPESKIELPPLPKEFHNLYASTTRVSTVDDPSLHGGRKRVTPHIEGNWPTHVYIEWIPSDVEQHLLANLISSLRSADAEDGVKLRTFLTSDLGAPLPLHVSLSRSLGFPTEAKDQFLSTIRSTLKESKVATFNLSISDLSWESNHEKTRWFLVLRVETNAITAQEDELRRLLLASNNAARHHGQPPLYANIVEDTPNGNIVRYRKAAFHISIAWTLEEQSQKLPLSDAVQKHLAAVQEISINVQEVKVKIGNVVTSIPLASKGKLLAESNLFGL